MKLKNLLIGLLSIVTALTLAACSGDTNEEDNSETPTEIETETNSGSEEESEG